VTGAAPDGGVALRRGVPSVTSDEAVDVGRWEAAY
jgi:hypothetical protein